MIRAGRNIDPDQYNYKKSKKKDTRLKALKERFDLNYKKILKLEELGKIKELKKRLHREVEKIKKESLIHENLPNKELKKQNNDRKKIMKKVEILEQLSYAERRKLQEEIKNLKEMSWPLENLSQKELKEQYDSQREILEKVKILEKLSNGELGIKGIDGGEYAFPKLEDMIKKIKEDEEVVKTKTNQGFKKLLII